MTSIKRIALVALIAGVFAACITRGTPTSEAPARSIAREVPFCNVNYLPVLSDFDGDRRLDQAELHFAGAHHCIRVRFGNSRETHLDVDAGPYSGGMLLVRDVNRDRRPDLIWVYHSRPQSALVWLGDGSGNFAKSAAGSRATEDFLLGDTDYTEAGSLEKDQVCLVPAPTSSDFPQVASLERDSLRAVMIPCRERRRDLGLYLSYLRERGPPQA